MMTSFREQPRAFYIIFILEIWERFGFYTAQGILMLYLIRSLGMSEVNAYYTFGAFSALVYGMVAFGGFLGDRILGTKRTIVLGLVVLALGYLALSFVASTDVYYALALVAVGNGLFKANPSNLLSKCYGVKDTRIDSAYTLYYMAVNVGALAALIIGPMLSNHYGYSYAYFASFIGILLGLANYWFQKKYLAYIDTPADAYKITLLHWIGIILSIILLTYLCTLLLQRPFITKQVLCAIILLCIAIYCFHMSRETRASRQRMLVALILMFEAILFFTLYQQLPTSLTLFAVHHVRATFFGITIDPQSFRALNSLWILLLSPCFVAGYAKINQQKRTFPIPYKFALGMFCCGLSFSLLFFSRYSYDEQMMISPLWVVASYGFQSAGEILVSALGIAMIAALVPGHIRGFVMGMWFLTSSIAGFTGAFVASLTGISRTSSPVSGDSLKVYTQVFGWIGISSLIIALMLWIIAPKLSKMMQSGKLDL